VQMGAVATHLARSDDGGQTFGFVGELWPSIAQQDPEGSGENGLSNSEVPALATISAGGNVYWLGAHLRYFQQPKSYYFPKFATSWTVHVGAALSPAGLATAQEAVLGVSTTAGVYHPNVALDQLAGLPIQSCAIVNNPSLYAQGTTLYLLVDCLAFVGTTLDVAHTTQQVFATDPSGAPASWTWRHVGALSDATLAQQLGDDTIQNPTIALAADGTPIAVLSLAHVDAHSPVGTTPDGCVVVALASIDPPVVQRDCAGRPVVRARITGTGDGACSYDRASRSGVIITAAGSAGWTLLDTAVQP